MPAVSSDLKNSFKFSAYQKLVVAILAFLQFTLVLDFMIISPMGAILMPALKISPAQFGMVVSAYAFSAALSGILAAGFADRYDRKSLLLFFYGGFLLGTFFCGRAQDYYSLLFARMTTGIFGGMIASLVMAISTDLFPLEARGRVLGFVQSAFSASQVLGIPLGIYFSNLWGWHAPFLMIVLIGLLAGAVIVFRLQPIRAHLSLQKETNPLLHLQATLTKPEYILAFAVTALLSVGGFMIMPFSSAYIVHNLQIPIEHLPWVYMITGVVTLFIGPLIGRASDRLGKYNVFAFGCILSAITVIIYTHLGVSSLGLVVLINVILFAAIFSRLIPSQALISAIPSPANRGSFMAVNSAMQQMAGGLAALVAGLIVVEQPDGTLAHFSTVGYIVVATNLTTMLMMKFIHNSVLRKTAQT